MNQNISGCDAAIQTLLDKQEIYEVLVNYCNGMDRRDDSLLRSVFHPDATISYGLFDGKASKFCDWSMAEATKYKFTKHSLSNVLIKVEGDGAQSEVYASAFHRIEKDGEKYDLVASGRYNDRFERRNGVWKIATRRAISDYVRCDPSTEEFAATVGDVKAR